MSETLTLNMGTFEVIDNQELLAVDGGASAQVWIVGICSLTGVVVGMAIGAAIGGPIASGIGGKVGKFAGDAAALLVSSLCGAIAHQASSAIIG